MKKRLMEAGTHSVLLERDSLPETSVLGSGACTEDTAAAATVAGAIAAAAATGTSVGITGGLADGCASTGGGG